MDQRTKARRVSGSTSPASELGAKAKRSWRVWDCPQTLRRPHAERSADGRPEPKSLRTVRPLPDGRGLASMCFGAAQVAAFSELNILDTERLEPCCSKITLSIGRNAARQTESRTRGQARRTCENRRRNPATPSSAASALRWCGRGETRCFESGHGTRGADSAHGNRLDSSLRARIPITLTMRRRSLSSGASSEGVRREPDPDRGRVGMKGAMPRRENSPVDPAIYFCSSS